MGRMEQIIEEIETYVDECKPQAFSSGEKIVVNKEELMDMIHELKMKTPDEVRKYQQIISNREAILADAQAKADAIIAEAQVQTNELISEHEIMQQAYAQANEIVLVASNQGQETLNDAIMQANDIRTGAMAYTDDLLKNFEDVLNKTMEGLRIRYENTISFMQKQLDTVIESRSQLIPAERMLDEAQDDSTPAEPEKSAEQATEENTDES